MAKKTVKTRATSLNSSEKDTRYLQVITRKLLCSLEESIENLGNVHDSDFVILQKTHELLFGNKTSIAGTLVILADLLLKLSGELPENIADKSAKSPEKELSESDIALVEAFISKMRASQNKNPKL